MFKLNKNLSLFKSARLVFKALETSEPPAMPESKDTALTPAEHKAERAKTTKKILEGVKQDRAALSNEQGTALTLKTEENHGDKLLMEDTSILIAQRGTGSKHNEKGWKGLALTTDSVKVLDRQVKLINGVEMVKVKLSHKLYTKPGAKDRYRTYIGYVPKKSFDPSVKLRAPEPDKSEREESIDRKAPNPIKHAYLLTANFFKNHGARSAIDYPHDFVVFGKKIHCNLQLLYGTGIHDRLLVKIKEDPKTKNPILEVYSPINIEAQDPDGKTQSLSKIAFLGNFLPTTNNIKNFIAVMAKHKEARITKWTEEFKEKLRQKKLKTAKAKFKQLFAKYDIKGASTGTTKGRDGKNKFVITYSRSGVSTGNQNLITATIDTSKDTFDYTVNGQHTHGLDATLRFAESILKREVGSPEETEE